MTALARLPKDLVERIENETNSKKILTFGRDGLPVFNGTTLEEHVGAWQAIDESMQCRHWAMAAIAASLVTKHNEKTVSNFASEVRLSARWIRQMAQTYRAFENGNRSPILSFSHHSVAATANNPVRAIQVAEDKEMSTRELERWIQLNELNRQTRRLVGLPAPGTPTLTSQSATSDQTETEEELDDALDDEPMSAEDRALILGDIELNLRVLTELSAACKSTYIVSRYMNGWIEELDWELREMTKSPETFSDRVFSLINSGCCVREQIAKRAHGSVQDTDKALALLKKQGKIEQRRQGGKTKMARGQVTLLWMPVDAPVGSDFTIRSEQSILEHSSDDSEEHF